MKKVLKLTLAASISAILAACGSTAPKDLNEDIPEWVLNPVVNDGLASASCVSASNNMSTDKAQATALARVELAQQIGTRVQNMDKTYQERVDADGQTSQGSTFSSVSKQLTDQSLTGARVVKTSYAHFNEKRQLCVMVTLGTSETKELFKNIIDGSKRNVSAKDESILYQEFKAYKAQQDLEREMSKSN